jgi:hypothetical protein
MKLDLLTNANVVDDAIRFVSTKTKEKLNLLVKVIKMNQMRLSMVNNLEKQTVQH